MVKGISRIPMALARMEEEDLVNFEDIELRQSQCFNLPDHEEFDALNQAFTSLILQKGEISPCVTDGSDSDIKGAQEADDNRNEVAPFFG